MKRIALRLILSICLSFAFLNAHAIPISVDPGEQTVNLGEQVVIDIVIDPRGDAYIGGFDFILNFDNSLLSFVSAAFGNLINGGSPLGSFFQDADVVSPGQVNVAEVSILTTDMIRDIQNRQPFVVATLIFDTLRAGTSNLDLSDIILSNPDGGRIAPFPINNGVANIIGRPTQVPEPSGLALFLIGFGLLLASRKRRPREVHQR